MTTNVINPSEGRKLYIQSQLDNKLIEVVAIGDRTNQDSEINSWLSNNPNCGVVDQWGSLVLIARLDDHGSDLIKGS